MGKLRISTEYWAKPIPSRFYDWLAVLDDSYEGGVGDPIGNGRTEEEAILRLLEIIDQEDAEYEIVGTSPVWDKIK